MRTRKNSKATAQLDAFPRSRNQAERQSTHTRCVVSIRMLGATVAKLDKEAERVTETEGRHPWNRATRTTIIERALAAYFAAQQTDNKQPRKGKR